MDSSGWHNNVGEFSVNIEYLAADPGDSPLSPDLPPTPVPDRSHPAGSGPIRWEVADGGNGHYYEYHSVQLRWAEARAAANDLGFEGIRGHLVNISTKGENDFVASLLPSDVHSVWLGANDIAIEGNWTWADGPEAGRPLGPYLAWNTNEPNNQNNEDAALFPGLSIGGGPGDLGKWFDGSERWHSAMVVEYSLGVPPGLGTEAIGHADLLTIIEQPMDLVIEHGESARFEAIVAGEAPFDYQWYFEGDPIPDAHFRGIEFFDVPHEQSGEYWLKVIDSNGNSRLSETASLTVLDSLAEKRGSIASQVTGRTVRGIHDSVIRFEPLSGDGKNNRMGLVFNAGSSWKALGTSWEFGWLRDESGIQLIHPVGSGQCIVSIHQDSVGISTPKRWVELGYAQGDERSIVRTPQFDRFFPLVDGVPYRIRSEVSTDGNVSVFVNRQLVAKGQASDPHPIDFMIGEGEVYPNGPPEGGGLIEGDGFPMVWGKGTAGLILEPVARETNEIVNVDFSPGPEAPAVIVSQPRSLVADLGQSVSLAVEAMSDSPIGYQWYFGNEAIPGATGSTLPLANVGQNHVGDYFVSVRNSAIREKLSRTATLSIPLPQPPKIVIQPVGLSVDAGMTASFRAAAIGKAPLFFQWYFDEREVGGATSPIFTLENVSKEQEGLYSLQVRNSVGDSVESVEVRLNIIIPEPPRIGIPLTNATADWGSDVLFEFGVEGTPPVEFTWTFQGALIPGQSSNSLTLEKVTNLDAGVYSVTARNRTGQEVKSEAELKVVLPPPPSIVMAPEDIVAEVGEDVELRVEVSGIGPFEYQWFVSDAEIEGATDSTLVLTKLALEHDGMYFVRVTGPAQGFVLSESARITVRPPEPPTIVRGPEGREVNVGDQVQFEVEATGSLPLRFQWLSDRGEIAGANSETLVLQRAEVTDAGNYRVVVSNALGDVTSLPANLVVIDPLAPPSNDDFENRSPLVGDIVTAEGNNINATREQDEPSHGDFSSGRSVWWSWQPTKSANVTVNTTGSEINTVLAIYKGNSLDMLELVASNDDAPGGATSSQVSIRVEQDTEYQIAIDAFGELSGDIQLALTSESIPPRLDVAISGTSIVLSWQPNGSDFRLEQVDRVNESQWKVVDKTPVALAGSMVVKIPMSEIQIFYRLVEETR